LTGTWQSLNEHLPGINSSRHMRLTISVDEALAP